MTNHPNRNRRRDTSFTRAEFFSLLAKHPHLFVGRGGVHIVDGLDPDLLAATTHRDPIVPERGSDVWRYCTRIIQRVSRSVWVEWYSHPDGGIVRARSLGTLWYARAVGVGPQAPLRVEKHGRQILWPVCNTYGDVAGYGDTARSARELVEENERNTSLAYYVDRPEYIDADPEGDDIWPCPAWGDPAHYRSV